MGWWGTHPMAGDDPLNVIDLFKEFAFGEDVDKCIDDDSYYNDDAIKERYLKLTPTQLLDFKNNKDAGYFKKYFYAVPYSYYEVKAFNLSDEMKEALKSFLLDSIKETVNRMFYNKEYTFETEYYRDFFLTNLLGLDVPEKSPLYFLYWQQLFLNHFDEVFEGKYDLDRDIGLINTMLGQKKKEKEPTDKNMRDFLVHFGPFYCEGWIETLYSYCGKCLKKEELKDATYTFLKTLALNGDADAQELIICYYVKHYEDDKEFVIHMIHEFLYNKYDEDVENASYKLEHLAYLFYTFVDESEELKEERYLGYYYFIDAFHLDLPFKTVIELADIALYSIENNPHSYFEADIDYVEFDILVNVASAIEAHQSYDEAFNAFEKYFYNKKDKTIRDLRDCTFVQLSDFIEDKSLCMFLLDPIFDTMFYLRFFAKKDYDALILAAKRLHEYPNLEIELLDGFNESHDFSSEYFKRDFANFKVTIKFLEEVKCKNASDKESLDELIKRLNSVVKTFEEQNK